MATMMANVVAIKARKMVSIVFSAVVFSAALGRGMPIDQITSW